MSENSSINKSGDIAKILMGDGEMNQLIRHFDWSKTPLGTIENWQQSLIAAVNLVLNSRFSMFLWWGEDLTYIYNDAYKPTLGVRHPAALGKSAREIWAEIWNVIGPQADAVIKKGESTWNEELLLFLERSGFTEETYHTFSYSPIIDDSGNIGGLFCAVSEVTKGVISRRRLQTLRDLGERTLEEAKGVEEACRAACETLTANPFDIPFALIYLLDADSRNARLCQATGFDFNSETAPETIEIGSEQDVWNFDEIFKTGHGEILSDVEEKFGRLSAGAWKDDWTRKAFILPLAKSGVPNASTGFLVCGISPRLIFDDDYRSFLELAAGHIATAIANARILEEERKRAAALAELDRAKTEFFSNVSHEFRTPLTLMLGNLEELLAENGALAINEKQQIESAHRNSLRLLKLVNTLLDFSRIEAGRQQAEFEPIDLSKFTAELASNFRSAVEAAGLELKIDCPSLSTPIFVDREMWEKIVLNLISNAFKFTFQGAIEISLTEKKAEVELKVKDSGVGIPANQLDDVFKRFHRVRQTQGRTFEGTGIGLSLVQELVKHHGGEIKVESELDKGTTFTVRIPKGKVHLSPEQIKQKSSQTFIPKTRTDVFLNEISEFAPSEITIEKPKSSNGNASHILLADDNYDMREYLRKLLEAEGYAVTAVADGQAALDVLQNSAENLPDLLLTDVMMPRLDGFQLLSAIRGNQMMRELPVIMLSARAGEEAKVEGLEAGADDYLVKPFSAREMLARVKTNLEMSRMRMKAAQRESEILESVGDCFLALDNDYRFVYFNRCAEDYFEVKRGEVLGKVLWEAFPSEKGGIFLEKYQEALETQEIIRLEAPSVVKENRWLSIDIYPSAKGLSIYFRDITDRKEAEEKLRESEERFRKMADHAPVMVWVTEKDASCSYLSQSWYEFTGQTPETGLGFGWLDAVHPDDAKMAHDIFVAANEESQPFRIEYRLRRKDGLYAWAIDSAQPRFGDDGRFLGYIGSVIDITERKLAEEKLQISERRFKAVFNHQFQFMVITTPEGIIEDVNQISLTATGTTPDQIIGIPFWKTPWWSGLQDAQKEWQENFRKLREGEELRISGELNYKISGNILHRAFYSVSALLGDSGEVENIIVEGNDITERKKAEEKIKASENQLRIVTDSIPALISYVDADFRYRFVNKIYTDWFGIKPEDIIGKQVVEVVGEKAFQLVLPKLKRALAGEKLTYEQLMPYETVGHRYVETTLVPDVESENRRVKGYFAFIQDISERKFAERDDNFLSNLSELIRTNDDEEEFIMQATEMIGQHLCVNRCFFAEIDEAKNLWWVKNDFHRDLPSVSGKYPVSAYPAAILNELRTGQICILEDTKTDLRTTEAFESGFEPLGLRSLIGIPLRRDGRWAANLAVADHEPREWKPREINLLETAAERFLINVEKLRNEKVLRESQAHLNLTTEAANIGTWQWNVATNQIVWNEIQQRMWGYEPSDSSADYTEGARLVLPEDMPGVETEIQRCLNGQEKYDVEYRIIPLGKDEIRWIRSTGKAFFDESGKTVSIQGISLDITERKEQENRLKTSEALLQGSIDALTKHIAVLDYRGNIINVNAAWRRFAEENLFEGSNYGLGSNYVEESLLIPEHTVDDCNIYGVEASEGIRKLLSEEQSYFEMEYPCHSPTEKRWFVMRVTSFGTGENLHVVVAHENVTDRKLSEIERERILESEQELRAQAEDANRLKDEFLATVSHELRTPLNAILGWSTMARKGDSDIKTMQRALEVIERSARNQNQIISDILEVSRIITGKLQLNLSTVQVPSIIKSAIDTLRPAIDAKAIDLKIILDESDSEIIGDPDRLQQIFWNLLSNAVKFTPNNGTIDISLVFKENFAEITVKDNGCGIEPEFLPFVFDRFRQADGKMNRKHGGLGLGLSIVRHLTELHGGEVSVASGGIDCGSTFTVKLPVKPTIIDSDKDNSKFGERLSGNSSKNSELSLRKLDGLKILVVDDEPNSLELAAFILTKNGAEILTANSVNDALKIFDHEKLDLLISDIGMPDRDGYELIEEIKKRKDSRNQQIPTIALTAYARKEDEEQLLKAGYEAFLPKPVEPSQLVELVTKLKPPSS
jgi:PAS domain S-box-containing protein